jgi:hypothetical protein
MGVDDTQLAFRSVKASNTGFDVGNASTTAFNRDPEPIPNIALGRQQTEIYSPLPNPLELSAGKDTNDFWSPEDPNPSAQAPESVIPTTYIVEQARPGSGSSVVLDSLKTNFIEPSGGNTLVSRTRTAYDHNGEHGHPR